MKHSLSLLLLILTCFSLVACDSDKESTSQADKGKTAPTPEATEHEITLVAGCSGCHGADGVSSRSDTPFIAGQPAKYLEYAIRSYLISDRKHEVMRQAVFDIDVAERQQLANYYSKLTTQWKGGRESQQTDVRQNDSPQINQNKLRAGQALSKPCLTIDKHTSFSNRNKSNAQLSYFHCCLCHIIVHQTLLPIFIKLAQILWFH